MRILHLRAGFLLLALALVAPNASALTLDDLNGGDSFMTGSLMFDSFNVSLPQSGGTSLADYDVNVLSDGFEILLPDLSNVSGIDLVVRYEVWGKDVDITGALLSMDASAGTPDDFAIIAEDLFDPPKDAGESPVAGLTAFAIGATGDTQLDDDVDLDPIRHLLVEKDINLANLGGELSISSISQRFDAPGRPGDVIPEPGAALLFAAGFALFSSRSRAR